MQVRLWRFGALLAIAVVGCTITGVFYSEVVNSEESLGTESFKGTFTGALEAFDGFVQAQLRAVRAIGDAMSTGASLPTPYALDRVRIYQVWGLTRAAYGCL